LRIISEFDKKKKALKKIFKTCCFLLQKLTNHVGGYSSFPLVVVKYDIKGNEAARLEFPQLKIVIRR
jgi:hypothetical protein